MGNLTNPVKIESIFNSEVKVAEPRTFIIQIESQFIPTPTFIKAKLGLGYKVLAVEIEKESFKIIIDVNSAVDAILYTGFRALARANHPDLGGNAEVMVILNRAKKELNDLIKELRG
jgi:hypothetical protein